MFLIIINLSLKENNQESRLDVCAINVTGDVSSVTRMSVLPHSCAFAMNVIMVAIRFILLLIINLKYYLEIGTLCDMRWTGHQ